MRVLPGLHYATKGKQLGRNRNPLLEDVAAAVDGFLYLRQYKLDHFPEKKPTVLVWRVATPQHFNTTPRGDYAYTDPKPPHGCVPAPIWRQTYNRGIESVLDRHCTTEQRRVSASGDVQRTARCAVNRSITAKNDTWQPLHRWYNASWSTWRPFLSSLAQRSAVPAGPLHVWNDTKLFDLPALHPAPHDCTHFCYVPWLYERAFAELAGILARERSDRGDR